MSQTETRIIENESKDKVVEVPCVKCSGATSHRVIGSIDRHGSEWEQREEWSVEWTDRYQVIKCEGCQSISFRHTSWFSEDVDSMTGDSGVTERLYPKRNADSVTAKSFYNVPSNLRRIYGELIDCFNNESATLCAAGLRALVEGICAHQGVVDGPVDVPAKGGGTQTVRLSDLAARIAGLQEKGMLTKTSATTLHEHRYLGNDAVHELARPSVEELKLAIDIIKHTLEQLYELPEKAEELKRAVAKRKLKRKQP